MLDKLSSRERVLAVVVAAIVPLFVLYSGYSWITSTLDSKEQEIFQLQRKNRAEKNLRMVGLLAGQRRVAYRDASLPKNVDTGFNEYKKWLFELADHCGLESPTSTNGSAGPQRLAGKTIFDFRSVKFDSVGTLDQIVQFLYAFEQKKTMHRINRLTIIPREGSPRGKDQLMQVSFTIETIGLPNANRQSELPEGDWNRLCKSLDEYRHSIVHRNFFGPPNSAPTFSSLSAPRVEPGKPVNFSISASDDEDDALKIELISMSGQGAELDQREGSNSAQFRSPGFEKEGRYAFEAKVTDAGCPPKSTTREFSIVVEHKKETVVAKEEPITTAGLTKISLLGRNAHGKQQVVIYFQADDEYKTFTVGDSFELDDKTWTIVSHDFNVCEIECDGKLLRFKRGEDLSNPIEDDQFPDSVSLKTNKSDEN